MNTNIKSKTQRIATKAAAMFVGVLFVMVTADAYARDVNYAGAEQTIFVTPGEPTQVNFPGRIQGGFKKKQSNLALERQDSFLVVFATPGIAAEGEALLVHLEDKRSYALRVLPASETNPRDGFINIRDERSPQVYEEEESTSEEPKRSAFAPPTVVSGLMREMVLVSEFGKRKGIAGYRRSNRYSGEVVLHDGTVEAKVEEIFMGANYWGYVLTVTNLLDTTQRINPATFRMDGTRAVTAERWELAPQPLTPEQQIANAHQARVYVVTKAKRR